MTPFKARLLALYTLLICANLAAGAWAFVLFSDDSVKLGTALLAYSLGLPHAVDADHIAAIDNVTRKLIQDGKRPITVGFFFALGHSTIVLIAASLIAFTVGALARFQSFSQIGGVIATATSAAFLGAQAAHGVSIGTILVFPALFAAGMALIDTTDGVLMLGAYQWAFVKPVRKLYYNMTITGVSALVAIVIGGIETTALIAHKLDLTGGGWKVASSVAEHFNALGFAIIGLFAAAWGASYFIYQWKRFDQIEVLSERRER
jgi:high-affinity nickel permease